MNINKIEYLDDALFLSSVDVLDEEDKEDEDSPAPPKIASNALLLEEVGREFGVTRERIRQIQDKAIRRLRHPSRGEKLRDYLD
jgi:hypothetical protein